MKKLIIILSVVMILVSAYISHNTLKSGISGSIEPPDGAKKVWAINGSDSTSVIPLQGKFTVDVKPGNWKLYIEAVPPYKNTTVEMVLVVDGVYTDAGVIKLPS